MAAHGPLMVPHIAKSARGYDRRPVVRPCNVSAPCEMLENTRANRPHADSRRACALPTSMITASVSKPRDNWPESVYEFGAWLKAHPAVLRVKLPLAIYERYSSELALSARFIPGTQCGYDRGFFTWRMVAAAFNEHAWPHRYKLFPRRIAKSYTQRLWIAS
jgi:hypothetical protein